MTPLPAQVRAALLLMLAFAITACAPHGSGNLTLKSQSQPGTVLGGAFTSSYYSLDDKNRLTVLLLDGSIEDPAQIVTIRMFWSPRAGRTPIDATATRPSVKADNATRSPRPFWPITLDSGTNTLSKRMSDVSCA